MQSNTKTVVVQQRSAELENVSKFTSRTYLVSLSPSLFSLPATIEGRKEVLISPQTTMTQECCHSLYWNTVALWCGVHYCENRIHLMWNFLVHMLYCQHTVTVTTIILHGHTTAFLHTHAHTHTHTHTHIHTHTHTHTHCVSIILHIVAI